MKAPDILFVYGSLQSGQAANRLLVEQGACYVAPARLAGYALYDLGSFPGIRHSPLHAVSGEAWRVPPEALPALDRYEGEGFLYARRQVELELEGQGFHQAYAYVYLHAPDPGRRVPEERQPWKAG